MKRRAKVKVKPLTIKIEPAIKRGWYFNHLLAVFVIVGMLGGYFVVNATSTTRTKPLIFQGRLTDNSYIPLSDGSTVYLKFAFYDAATSGNCLWATGTRGTGSSNCSPSSSSAGVATTVTRGIFTVALGDSSVTSMPVLPLDFNPSASYIGVTACTATQSGCDSEMTPRVRIGGAAYSFNADELDGRDSSQFLLGNETLTLPAVTSGTATTTTMTFGAHTGRTAAELIDFDVNLNRTVTFTAGASFASQRAMVIEAPTYAASAAQTITEAATLAIAGVPAEGANMTISSRTPLWIQGTNLTYGAFIDMDYPAATTMTTSANDPNWLLGTIIDFATNMTVAGSTNAAVGNSDHVGQLIQVFTASLPASTVSTASAGVTMQGLNISGGAIISNASAAQASWYGAYITMPDLTQTTGTATAVGLRIKEGTYTSGASHAIRYSGSAVAHGLTAIAPTDVVYQLSTLNGGGLGTGGTLMTSMSDSDSPGMRIISVIGGSGSSTNPALYLSGSRVNSSDATKRGMLSNHETLLYISNDDVVKFTMNGSGDLGLGDPTPNGTLDLLSTVSASSTSIILTNPYGFDPVINFEIAEGTGAFSLGVDNSDSDQFKLSASGTLGTTDMYIVNSAATSNTVNAHVFDTPSPSIASAASAFYTTFLIDPPTITLTGSTQVTSMMEAVNINTWSIAAGSVTVDDAATFTLDGAPGRTSGTLTDSYALYIKSNAVGTVGTSTALYIRAQTGATNNYAAVFETGNVGVGVIGPVVRLDVDGALSLRDSGTATNLTGDDTTITVGDRSYIKIDSTCAAATNCTFILTQSTRSGQVLILEFVGTGTDSAELVDDATMSAGNARLSATWTATQYDTLKLISNGTDWVEVSRSTN